MENNIDTRRMDNNEEKCYWKFGNHIFDKTRFVTQCGHICVWGGMPMLGGYKCGYCKKRVEIDKRYIELWQENHIGYEWKDEPREE